jgi:hypothetical protein
MEMQISGGTSTEAFGRAFDEAINNPDVGAIVIDTDRRAARRSVFPNSRRKSSARATRGSASSRSANS